MNETEITQIPGAVAVSSRRNQAKSEQFYGNESPLESGAHNVAEMDHHDKNINNNNNHCQCRADEYDGENDDDDGLSFGVGGCMQRESISNSWFNVCTTGDASITKRLSNTLLSSLYRQNQQCCYNY